MKIAVKLVFSRLPISYRKWAKLGFFKLGKMADAGYAIKIFSLHFKRTVKDGNAKGCVFLEMGPGDSVASALLAYSVGAKKIYLIDVDDFAIRDIQFYKSLAETLKTQGLNPPAISEMMTFEDLLRVCNAEYLTQGCASLKTIASNSVNFSWSHSTLEHIRKHELQETMAELYRVMAPYSVSSHIIDLMDHLGGRLNHLRFSERIWESGLMANSGFYTNRWRYSEIIKILSGVGFKIENKQQGRWDDFPTPRHKLAKSFRIIPERDLLIRTMSVELHKVGTENIK